MTALPTGHALRGLLLASTLLIASPAFAADATKIANDLVAALGARGDQKAGFDSAEASGDDVVISNLKVTEGGGQTMTVPQVVITAPQDRQPGGFTASRMTADGGSGGDAGTTMSWATAVVEDAVIPAPSEITSNAKLTPFSSLSVTGVSVSEGGKPPVTIAEIGSSLTTTGEGALSGGSLNATGIAVPAALIASDDAAGQQLQQLGYTNGLNFDLMVSGTYDDASQVLTLSELTVDGEEMGKFSMSGTFGGLPRDKLQDPDKTEELAATATVGALTIRFDNSGIVERVLEMQGQAMGVSGPQFGEQIAAGLPLMLNFLGNPAFQQKVATAAGSFLKEPKSLTITASPASPVPVMQVVGAAQTAPQTLPDILSVDITAND